MDDSADDNNDGLSNLLEYAFNRDPGQPESGVLPVPVINPGPLTYKLAETVLGLGLSPSRKAYAPPTYPRPGLAVAMMDGAAKWVPED